MASLQLVENLRTKEFSLGILEPDGTVQEHTKVYLEPAQALLMQEIGSLGMGLGMRFLPVPADTTLVMEGVVPGVSVGLSVVENGEEKFVFHFTEKQSRIIRELLDPEWCNFCGGECVCSE